MSAPRDVRRLAFQVLYQLDARADEPPQRVIESVLHDQDDSVVHLSPAERRKAFALASDAFEHRATADAFMQSIAPDWPVHRQAAVDRAILRLAYYEMMSTSTHPKIVVNEAVELAKDFSTDKSPAFINGLLDKALKVALAGRADHSEPGELRASSDPADSAQGSAT